MMKHCLAIHRFFHRFSFRTNIKKTVNSVPRFTTQLLQGRPKVKELLDSDLSRFWLLPIEPAVQINFYKIFDSYLAPKMKWFYCVSFYKNNGSEGLILHIISNKHV